MFIYFRRASCALMLAFAASAQGSEQLANDSWGLVHQPASTAGGAGDVTPASFTTDPAVSLAGPIALSSEAVPQPAPYVVAPLPGEATEAGCLPCDLIYRNRAWLVAVETIGTRPYFTRGLMNDWPLDDASAYRLVLGYQADSGLGWRARFGRVRQEFAVNDPNQPFWEELGFSSGTFTVDFFKRLYLDETEILVGAGPAAGDIDFSLLYVGNFIGLQREDVEFQGGGATGVVEGWHPFLRFAKLDVGLAGRGRLAVLTGDWRTDTDELIPPTRNDTLRLIELAWGFELRRRFGASQDKYWFISALWEEESRDSAWLAGVAGTALGLSSFNVTFGLMW